MTNAINVVLNSEQESCRNTCGSKKKSACFKCQKLENLPQVLISTAAFFDIGG